MSEFESPISSWIITSLGDLSEVKSGVGFPKKYQGQSSGDYPVYKVGDVSRSVTQGQGLLGSANHYVNTEEATVLKGVIFRSGSTLFAKIGEAVKLNRRAFVTLPGLADNNVMAVVPLLRESDRYLHYFLRTVDLSDVSRSTTVPSVRKGDIEGLLVPLPSLAEQKAIAEKLDTLLARVESTKARLERIPKILKRFRQSVLAAAVSGKLTEEWRGGREFIPNMKELGEAAKFIDYRGKTPKKKEAGIPLITAKNIRQGYISREPREFIAEDDYDSWMTRGIPSFGDVLITTEAPMGYVANIDIEERFALAQRAVCLKFNHGISPYYASIYMQSYDFQKALSDNATGSTVKGIKAALLKKIAIVAPSEEEQAEIVRRVDQLFAYADTIETQVNNALERVNNLTQSILAKAFRGELTEQWRKDNPALISGENSAEALLEKIKAERAAAKPAKRGRKKAK